MHLEAEGFTTGIELNDTDSFDQAVQLLDVLKQREHSKPLDHTEIVQQPVQSDTGREVDAVHESVDQIMDRVAELEDTVTDLAEQENSADHIENEAVDRLAQEIESLTKAVDHIENRVIKLESRKPREETSRQEQESEETESEPDLKCPQCGKDDFSSVQGVSTHINRSQDHKNIKQFFTDSDGQFECPEGCGTDLKYRSTELSDHLKDEHGLKLVKYYLQHHEELVEQENTEPEEEEKEEDTDPSSSSSTSTEKTSDDETQTGVTEENTESDETRGEEQTKAGESCGHNIPLAQYEDMDECPECGEPLEQPEFDRLPALIEDGIVDVELPYTHSQFKRLDTIEQAAVLYEAGMKITEGDVTDYADTVLENPVDSANSKEAGYIRKILHIEGIQQYFDKDTEERSFGRDKVTYRLEDALPTGVEDYDTSGWTVNEFKDLSEPAKSELVLETLHEIGPATREDVENHIYSDSEDPNGQIRRLLENYLVQMVAHNRQNGEKRYTLKHKTKKRLQKDALSYYQAQQKHVSGRSQYVCQDCNQSQAFDSVRKAKKHRRDEGHLNWDRKAYLPWRNNGSAATSAP